MVDHLTKKHGGAKLAKSTSTLFMRDFKPNLDKNLDIRLNEISYYEKIEVIQWMVAIRRIDMINEVSILASQLAMTREEGEKEA